MQAFEFLSLGLLQDCQAFDHRSSFTLEKQIQRLSLHRNGLFEIFEVLLDHYREAVKL